MTADTARRTSVFGRYAPTAGETGAAGGQTLIAVLLPLLLAPHAPSTFWIGAVIATEGIFALVIPYVVGALGDENGTARAGLGPRTVLIASAAPFMALALVLLPFRDSFAGFVALAMVYFLALHTYASPLRALLIERTPERAWGSVQGVLGTAHIAGVGFGLVGGGLLFALWEPLPFLVGAALVVLTTAVTLLAARRGGRAARQERTAAQRESADRSPDSPARDESRLRQELGYLRGLLAERGTRRLLGANFLWNAGIEGIRPYVMLFATVVVGIRTETASLALLGFLAAAGLGSAVVGRIGDRVGRTRLLAIGAACTGLAMLPGLFVRDLWLLIVMLIPAGLGAAAIVALPYAVFESAVPEDEVGRTTGAFYASIGLARLLGPLLVGGAIELGLMWMPEHEGYPAMWPVAGALVLAGALLLTRAR